MLKMPVGGLQEDTRGRQRGIPTQSLESPKHPGECLQVGFRTKRTRMFSYVLYPWFLEILISDLIFVNSLPPCNNGGICSFVGLMKNESI